MSVQRRDFVDVAARARELGCRVPAGIALLPGNFPTAASADEFCYHAATPYVRTAWQSVGLEDEGPQAQESAQPAKAEGTGPVAQRTPVPLAVFFGAGLLGGPEWGVTVALSMVSRVLALHPKCACPMEVRFDAVVERPSGGYACIEYRGDAYGLVALARDVRRIWEMGSGNHSGGEAVSLRRSRAAGHVHSPETREARKHKSPSKGGGDA